MPENDIVNQLQSTYRDYLGAAGQFRQRMQECRQFTNGEVYTRAQLSAFKKIGLPPVSVPLIETCIDQAVSLLTARPPEFECSGFDDSDVELAKSWNMFLSYLWYQSSGDSIHKRVVRDRFERGIGYKLAYFDPSADFGRGDLRIAYVDPNNVLVSPGSTDFLFRDSPAIQVAKIVTGAQFLKYNGHLPTDFLKGVKAEDSSELTPTTSIDGSGLNPDLAMDMADEYADTTMSFGFGKSARREDKFLLIDNFEKVRRQYHRVLDTQSNEEDIFSARALKLFKEQPVMFLREANGNETMLPPGVDPEQLIAAMTEKGIEGQIFDAPRQHAFDIGLYDSAPFLIDRIERTTIVGDKVVNKPHDLPISEYPVVPYPHKHIGSPYPKSAVDFAMQPARMYNRLLMLGIGYLSNAVGLRAFVPVGSVRDLKAAENKMLQSVALIEYDASNGHAPAFANMPPLPVAVQSFMADMKHKIEYIFGIFEGTMGNTALAPETVRGGMLVDQQGQRRIKSHQQDIEASDGMLGRLLMEWAQSVYTTDKYFRVLTPNGESETRRILADNWGSNAGAMNRRLQTIYDVRVKSGSTLPVNREMEEQVHFRNFQAGVIDRIEYLKKTNLYDLEGVLKRTDDSLRQQGVIDEQAKKIKTLEGDLQTATRESVNDRKRLEVNDFELRLKKLLVDLEAEGKIMSAEMKMILEEVSRLSQTSESLDSSSEQAIESIDRQNGAGGDASV